MGTGSSTQFNSSSTVDEVLAGKDLTGKVVCVTGANTGLGKETCRALAQANATVVMACRNMDKAAKARDEIVEEVKSDDVGDRLHLVQLDLGDLENVNTFDKRYGELNLPCHYLIQNAGIMNLPNFETTPQGIEKQWGVCHVGHFLQAKRMLPFLQRDPPSRLVCVSSSAHNMAPSMDEFLDRHATAGDLGQTAEEYGGWSSYGVAKISNVFFAREFNRRYESEGITAVSLHPGGIMTDLQRHTTGPVYAILWMMQPFLFKTVPQGAATQVRCAIVEGDEFVPGAYYEDCNPANAKLSAQAALQADLKPEERREYKLWEYTEQVLGKLGFE